MILSFAWKNIWRKPIRSLIVIISIVLGLWATIFMFAYVAGIVDQRFVDAISFEISHIQTHHPNFKIDNEPQYVIKDLKPIREQLMKAPTVKAFASRSITNGMIASANNSQGSKIIGIVPDEEYVLTKIDERIETGRALKTGDKNKIVIGKSLAKKLKVKLRSKVVLTFSDANQEIVAGAFKVVGIYQSYNASIEDRICYVMQHDLNRLLAIGGDAHQLAVLLHSDEALNTLAGKISANHPENLTETWEALSPELSMMINSLDEYMIIFLIIILLALCFGIINTMLMSVLERVREIGMLMSIGMNKLKIFILIMIETILIIGIATPFGVLMAYITIAYFNTNGLNLTGMADATYREMGFQTIIYPSLTLAYYLRIILIVAIASFIASLYPAYTAIKLNPVEAIRKN